MVPLYNYTSLKTEDTKIYDIGGYNIPGGLSLAFTYYCKIFGNFIIAL